MKKPSKKRPTLAKWLAAAIDASPYTRAEVARRANMKPQNLHNLLTGIRDPVARAARVNAELVQTIHRLAAALDVDPPDRLLPG